LIYPIIVLRPQEMGGDISIQFLKKLEIPSEIIDYIRNSYIQKEDNLKFLECAIEKMIKHGYYNQWKKIYFEKVIETIFP